MSVSPSHSLGLIADPRGTGFSIAICNAHGGMSGEAGTAA